MLLGLKDGALKSAAQVGSDPVAVIVSADGRTAFVADSAPGDVYAVNLPGLSIKWKQHLGGAPFGLLLHSGSLWVTLFDSAAAEALDPTDGHPIATAATGKQPAAMTEDAARQLAFASNGHFGVALVDGDVWTADYKQQTLIDTTHPRSVQLPLPVFPFWLAPGANASLLIAAEGANEDADPGAVLSYEPSAGTFQTLARPRDPDQVIQFGSAVLVPAHGDREVLALDGGGSKVWARGASAVALAADSQLGLLVVVVNSHE